MDGVRHVEVQVQGDRHGAVWAIGVRDCTIQRRYQKLVAEAPATGLSPEETALKDAAGRLVAAAHYRDQASVEFLFDLSGRFYFIEVNTRLQVEHVVTEHTSGVDLVKLVASTWRAAAGSRESRPRPPATRSRSVSTPRTRLGLRGVARRRDMFRLPTGPGLRVDSGVAEGDRIPPEFGSMFAKLAARATPRRGARPAQARAGRERDRVQGRHHEPDVPSAAARPGRGAARQRGHGPGSIG